ncbi:glycosyltransferase [Mangrovicella endophytica]|uniref:glycosyltransferase n=1 Tax=Mangrovicella endophytica TaxID=2066697 RepID=UPI001FDF0E76|nr:glycosyltransferase [Mangrovicella endophytica]
MFEDGATAHLRMASRDGGVTLAVPVLPAGSSGDEAQEHQRRLVDTLLAEFVGAPRILWYYTPVALGFTEPRTSDVVVYDNMDELSAFLGAPPELIEIEKRLLSLADVVFTGGMSLYEAKRDRHPNVKPFPSSIDAAHFAAARGAGVDTDDQAGIPHPRIGFFGVIDERLDVDLLRETALLRPDWHFVVIGPVVKIDPQILPQADNIHWLGGRSYSDLPRYLGGWDAGFMPFALNEATRFISPTKTPEYLAAGIPVVSTPIADVVRPYGTFDLVGIAATAAEAVAAIESALARPKEPWLTAVDTMLATMSWDLTWAAMDEEIRRIAARKVQPWTQTQPIKAMEHANV